MNFLSPFFDFFHLNFSGQLLAALHLDFFSIFNLKTNNKVQMSDPLTCLIKPVFPCLFWGGAFTGLSVYQGLPQSMAPRSFYRTFSFLYIYHAVQCPLEFLSGRRSWSHNAIAGATLGYLGVMKQVVGIPFVDATFFIKYRQISPPLMGAIVYGGLAGVLGSFSKPL